MKSEKIMYCNDPANMEFLKNCCNDVISRFAKSFDELPLTYANKLFAQANKPFA